MRDFPIKNAANSPNCLPQVFAILFGIYIRQQQMHIPGGLTVRLPGKEMSDGELITLWFRMTSKGELLTVIFIPAFTGVTIAPSVWKLFFEEKR